MSKRVIQGFYEPHVEKIETKEDLLIELHNLQELYLRLKEEFLVEIWIEYVTGKVEVTDFRHFLAIIVMNSGKLTLERDTKFIVDDEVFDQIHYSFIALYKLINPMLNKRVLAKNFVKAIAIETRKKDPLSEWFP